MIARISKKEAEIETPITAPIEPTPDNLLMTSVEAMILGKVGGTEVSLDSRYKLRRMTIECSSRDSSSDHYR